MDVPIQETSPFPQMPPLTSSLMPPLPIITIPDVWKIDKITSEKPSIERFLWRYFLPLFLLFLILFLWYGQRVRKSLRIPRSKLRKYLEYKGKREFILKKRLPKLLSYGFLDHFAYNLGYFQSTEIDDQVDISQTIEATCQRGFPEIVFQHRHLLRQVIILEDRKITQPPIYKVSKELFDGLEQRGIPIKYGYFYGCPDRFIISKEGEYLLEDLDDERNGYLILIFSDSQSIDFDKHKFVLEDLSHFPYLVWLETRLPDHWDGKTELISRYVQVFPSTPEGLQQVIKFICSEKSILIKSITSVPSPDLLEDILQNRLQWACACALLQPMNVGVAEHLRQRFFPYLSAEDIQILLDLPNTQQTNAGFYFSRQITQQLLKIMRDLFPEQEKNWRSELNQILNEQEPKEESLAYQTWEFQKKC